MLVNPPIYSMPAFLGANIPLPPHPGCGPLFQTYRNASSSAMDEGRSVRSERTVSTPWQRHRLPERPKCNPKSITSFSAMTAIVIDAQARRGGTSILRD